MLQKNDNQIGRILDAKKQTNKKSILFLSSNVCK